MLAGWLAATVLPWGVQEPQPVFRAETALALVRFHVVRSNRYATGLKPEDIVLLEDGVAHKPTLFEARDAAAMPGSATRMLLVFSDGFPTTNTHPEDAASVAREFGIPLYPVVLGHARIAEQAGAVQKGGYRRDGSMKEGARRRLDRLEDRKSEMRDFASLGELTGGRSFDPPLINLNIVRQILTGIAAQVACEYVVGFSPPPSDGAPKRHKVEVRLARKELGKVLGGTRMMEH